MRTHAKDLALIYHMWRYTESETISSEIRAGICYTLLERIHLFLRHHAFERVLQITCEEKPMERRKPIEYVLVWS